MMPCQREDLYHQTLLPILPKARRMGLSSS